MKMIKKLFYQFIDWLDETKLWKSFFKTLNHFTIRIRGYPEFEMSDYFKITDQFKPNTYYTFLSTDTKSLTSIVIKWFIGLSRSKKGYFSHSGIIISNGYENTNILHVREEGLIEEPLLNFLKKVDYFCIIEMPLKENANSTIIKRIEELRKKAIYIQYDWEIRLNNDSNKLYCSELNYKIFKDLVNNPNFKPKRFLGRYIFDPDLLLSCGKILYCNHPQIKNQSA